MKPYYWYTVTFEFLDHAVEIKATVSAYDDGEAADLAGNLLHDMGLKVGACSYQVERQDPVEAGVW